MPPVRAGGNGESLPPTVDPLWGVEVQGDDGEAAPGPADVPLDRQGAGPAELLKGRPQVAVAPQPPKSVAWNLVDRARLADCDIAAQTGPARARLHDSHPSLPDCPGRDRPVGGALAQPYAQTVGDHREVEQLSDRPVRVYGLHLEVAGDHRQRGL
jgi:hypothetical protein